MTLIKCFTTSHIDNLAACLRLQPDKMILTGKEEEMRFLVERYQKMLRDRGLRTEITLCDLRGDDLQALCAVLGELVRKEPNCVIDLTGGDELVIMAVGAVLAGLDTKQRQGIRVEKFDHDSDGLLDCIHDNCKLLDAPVKLTVEELVALHGGSLLPETYPLPADCNRSDLAGLWSIVSDEPKKWNRAITLLNEFESRADSKTHIYLPLQYLRGSISNFEEKEPIVRTFLDKLQRHGIIADHSNHYALEYTYHSPIMRYCTQKAGNVLEVKTLLEGRAVAENGVPFFHDCRMSVSIDWDGVLYHPKDGIPETRNEVDVVLMHGTTALFISCKNGNIGDEELYKLHTVASHFGGPYARKMLIATDLDRKSHAANRAFMQRAWDMDIFLVTDAAELSPDEWRDIFLKAVQ